MSRTGGADNPVRVWLAFLLLALAWGSSYLFIRVGLEQITPLALVALRLAIGAAGIWMIALVRRLSPRVTHRELFWISVLATTNTTVPFLLITWGEETVPSGLASVLNSTVPIFSLVFAGALLGDEPITAPRLGGVALGFTGVIVLLSRDLAHGVVHWGGVAGQGAIVLAAAFYAASAVMARMTLRRVSSMTVAVLAVSIAALQAVALSLIFSPPPVGSLHVKTILALLWLGLLGSAFAYVFYYYILENWGATRTTLVTYVLPVVGLTLGAVVLHESFDWRIVVGSVLVVGGVLLAGLVRHRATTSTHEESEGSLELDPSRNVLH